MKSNVSPRILKASSIFTRGRTYYIHRATISADFPLHQHEFFEIDIILSGSAKSNVNGKLYNIEKGSVLFLTPADFHDVVLTSKEPLITYNLAFSSSLIYSRVWSAVPLDCKIANLPEEDYQSVTSTCKILLREYDTETQNIELIMKTGIEWILFWIAANSPQKPPASLQNNNDILSALAFIFDNFTSPITREGMAEMLHISPTHFSKKFHAATGSTFQDYLLNLRLNYAMGLIKTTDLTMAEIASSSGFNSLSYFFRAFKRNFSNPPGFYTK